MRFPAFARAWGGVVGRYVLSDNDSFETPGFGTTALKVTGASAAFGVDVEYKFNRWFGLDAAAGYTKVNVHFTSSNDPGTDQSQRMGLLPLMLAPTLHFVHSPSVDIWLGPQVAYVLYRNDISFDVSGSGTFSYKPKNSSSLEGFVVGTDITLTKHIALNLAMRWQNSDGDADGQLTIDPTFVTVGFTKR